MKVHYLSAFLAEILTQIGMLATFFYIGATLSPTSLFEYAFVRRVFSLVFPVCILGLDTGLARFGWTFQKSAHSLILSVFIISLPIFIVISIIALFFQNQLITMLFGSTLYNHYLIPLLILIPGGVFHACAYNIYRGILKTHAASSLLVLNHGLAPLVLVFVSDSIDALLSRVGIFWILSSSCYLFPLLWNYRMVPFDNAISKTILTFGLKRFPADLLNMAFFSLPVIITAHIWGTTIAGQIALGLSLIGMVGSALSPFNVVFLPHISKLIHERAAVGVIKRGIPSILMLLVIILLFVIIAELLITPIVQILFSSTDKTFVLLLRVLLLGIAPYSIYSLAKSLIDIQKDGSLNSRNMGISLLFFIVQSCVGFAFQLPPISTALFIVSGLVLLSILTLIDVKRFIATELL